MKVVADEYDPPKVIWVWRPWYWNLGRKLMGGPETGLKRDLGYAWCFCIVEVQFWRRQPVDENVEEEESAVDEDVV